MSVFKWTMIFRGTYLIDNTYGGGIYYNCFLHILILDKPFNKSGRCLCVINFEITLWTLMSSGVVLYDLISIETCVYQLWYVLKQMLIHFHIPHNGPNHPHPPTTTPTPEEKDTHNFFSFRRSMTWNIMGFWIAGFLQNGWGKMQKMI